MTDMQLTEDDKRLLLTLPQKVEEMKQGILRGEPYVWKLRLSLKEFYDLESAINQSISSHAGSHEHLLTADFAIIVVIYLAEWYKRFYNGVDTMDENKVLALNTEELKRIYDLAGIDPKTFVYNASKNPDKTSYRWQESLQVLGGLAVQAELKRDKQGRLLSYVAGDFDCYEASRYTYDSTSGLLKTISNECPDSGSDVTTYIYDNKGYAVKMEVKGSRGEMGEEPEPYESTKTFTYDGFDSKGNWTLRKGKDSTEKTEWTETRIITYFE